MTGPEVIGLATLLLTYLSGLIGMYVQMRVKLKELDVRVLSIQNDLNEFKKTVSNDIKHISVQHDKSLERIDEKFDKINEKLDIITEKIYQRK